MTNLSPTAQAVLDAYKNAPDLTLDGDPDEVERRLGLAAAFRAVSEHGEFVILDDSGNGDFVVKVDFLRAIAKELEGA
jgi:hypothetical protein